MEEAIYWLEAESALQQTLKTALLSRLRFRKAFLVALDFEQGITDAQRPSAWEHCSEILPMLLETRHLGTLVEHSFSGKIQRRLASSVPPRPIVKISFDQACTFLERLCTHSKEAYSILRYDGPSCAMVCAFELLGNFIDVS